MIKGQDWSSYQANQPDVTGLDFAFTKVTEGLGYENPRWVAQRDWAKHNGLVWGAYHYPHMANDPAKEADYFLGRVAWKPGDIIFLDWEGYDDYNKGVSDARKLAYRDAWLKYVKGKMPNHRVGMYCNVDYWTKIDKTSNCGDFLFIATAGRAAGDPGIQAKWLFHQYSTANNIDHDVANFASRAALAAWANLEATHTGGTDMTLSKDDLAALVHTDGVIAAPDKEGTPKGNLQWNWESYLRYGFLQDRETNAKVKELEAKIDKLQTGGVDLDLLAAKVADLLAKRLQS